MKRFLIITTIILVVLGSCVSAGLWFFLSSWVPENGRDRLILEIEKRYPVEVEIGSLTPELLQGVRMEEVLITHRQTHQVWLAAQELRLGIKWTPLLLQRTAAFRVDGLVEEPCEMAVRVLGRVHLKTHAMAFDVKTEDVLLRSLEEPLKQFVPKELTDGTVRAIVHIRHTAPNPPLISGEVHGTDLVWSSAAGWKLTANVIADGRLSPPAQPGTPWNIEAKARIRGGRLDGFNAVGPITDLEGSALASAEEIQITALSGKIFGSPWLLEGVVTLGPVPRVEALLDATLDLKQVAAVVPAAKEWRAEGTAMVRASCRATLSPALIYDCMTEEELRHVTVSGPSLPQPLTDVSGRVAFDLLTRQLTIGTLQGTWADEPLTASGHVRLEKPMVCALQLKGVMPMDAILGFLPAQRPVSQLRGSADIALEINGSLANPELSGSVELQEVGAVFEKPAVKIEHATGTLRFTPERMVAEGVTLRVNDQPLVITAHVAPAPEGGWAAPRNTPRVSANIRLPQGELKLDGRLSAERFTIDEAAMVLRNSSLRLAGFIAKRPGASSELRASGTVELSELSQLPFVPLPAIEQWRIAGTAKLDARFSGPIGAWNAGTLSGRFEAERLSIKDIPLQQVIGEIEQTRGALRIRIPSAFVADGRFRGEFASQPEDTNHKFLTQAEITGLQLEQLAKVIPAWKSRSASGIASGQLLISGVAEEKATWMGEGWMNASGERLGDLPLLDKVFRGLFGLLGERLGLESLRRAEITDAALKWRLAQGRFQTEDFRLGGHAGEEPIAVYGKGSAGLDGTLDFVIEPELSERVVLESPSASSLARTVLQAAGQLERFRQLIGRHRLTGTIKEPLYKFEFTPSDVLKELAPGPIDLLQGLFGR